MPALALKTGLRRAQSLRYAIMAACEWIDHRPWLLVPLLAIPAVLPFYRDGLPVTADGLLHIVRLVVLDHSIHQGVLYPRWATELMLGYGYPVFSFYGPATYYLAEALHLGGLGYFHAFMGTLVLLVILAGGSAYLLARDLFGKQHGLAALVVAVAYMYSPYLLTNVFVRGAIAEVAAQALLPWILWSLRRIMRAKNPARYI